MSLWESCFDELYTVQTECLGIAILATITGFAVSKPAILSSVDTDLDYIPGSTAERGGYELKIKQSDMPDEPPTATEATCNGDATGKVLQVISTKLSNGVWTVQVGDIQV